MTGRKKFRERIQKFGKLFSSKESKEPGKDPLEETLPQASYTSPQDQFSDNYLVIPSTSKTGVICLNNLCEEEIQILYTSHTELPSLSPPLAQLEPSFSCAMDTFEVNLQETQEQGTSDSATLVQLPKELGARPKDKTGQKVSREQTSHSPPASPISDSCLIWQEIDIKEQEFLNSFQDWSMQDFCDPDVLFPDHLLSPPISPISILKKLGSKPALVHNKRVRFGNMTKIEIYVSKNGIKEGEVTSYDLCDVNDDLDKPSWPKDTHTLPSNRPDTDPDEITCLVDTEHTLPPVLNKPRRRHVAGDRTDRQQLIETDTQAGHRPTRTETGPTVTTVLQAGHRPTRTETGPVCTQPVSSGTTARTTASPTHDECTIIVHSAPISHTKVADTTQHRGHTRTGQSKTTHSSLEDRITEGRPIQPVVPRIENTPPTVLLPATEEYDMLAVGRYAIHIVQNTSVMPFWRLPRLEFSSLARRGQGIVINFMRREMTDWAIYPKLSAYSTFLMDSEVHRGLSESIPCQDTQAKTEIRYLPINNSPMHTIAARTSPYPLSQLPPQWASTVMGSIVGTCNFVDQPLALEGLLANLSLMEGEAIDMPTKELGTISESEYRACGFFSTLMRRLSAIGDTSSHVLFIEFPPVAGLYTNNLSLEGISRITHVCNIVRILQSYCAFPVILFLPPPPFQGKRIADLLEVKRTWAELARRIRILSRILLAPFVPIFTCNHLDVSGACIAPFSGGNAYLYDSRGHWTPEHADRIKIRFLETMRAVAPACLALSDFRFMQKKFARYVQELQQGR